MLDVVLHSVYMSDIAASHFLSHFYLSDLCATTFIFCPFYDFVNYRCGYTHPVLLGTTLQPQSTSVEKRFYMLDEHAMTALGCVT